MDSILTSYGMCAICGTTKDIAEHHLVFGRGLRPLAENDGLKIPICPFCHGEIHTKSAAASELSRICGQLAFEKSEVAKGVSEEDAREHFRKRYGKSYL